MTKWLFTLFLAIFLLGLLMPWLSRHFHLGRLPGDLACRYRGKNYRFPFTSTLLLSLILFVLMKVF